MPAHLALTRSQILAFRRRVTALDERLPRGKRSLQRAAWAGLQDSMPRAALLSIHARLSGTKPISWEDPALVQVWGPRFSAYVIPKRDLAVFTLGRLPDEPRPRQRALDLAARLESALEGRRMSHSDAARAMKLQHPNELRYAAATGTVLIRWDGSRQPTIWSVPAPEMEPRAARLELVRRCLHVFGPTTPQACAQWAGIGLPAAAAAFEALDKELTPVRTPIGDAWILREDEPLFRAASAQSAAARLLPSGDTWFLLQGADRELLLPNPSQRAELWTSRVWPGALLVNGETVGIWRRAAHVLTIQAWRRLSRAERDTVEAEALSMPLPGVERSMEVRWAEG